MCLFINGEGNFGKNILAIISSLSIWYFGLAVISSISSAIPEKSSISKIKKALRTEIISHEKKISILNDERLNLKNRIVSLSNIT